MVNGFRHHTLEPLSSPFFLFCVFFFSLRRCFRQAHAPDSVLPLQKTLALPATGLKPNTFFKARGAPAFQLQAGETQLVHASPGSRQNTRMPSPLPPGPPGRVWGDGGPSLCPLPSGLTEPGSRVKAENSCTGLGLITSVGT